MRTLALVATVLLAIPATASAEKVKKIAGVTYFSDSIWTNQLKPDEPVVAFPIGCTGSKCDFTIRLEIVQNIASFDVPQNPQRASILRHRSGPTGKMRASPGSSSAWTR